MIRRPWPGIMRTVYGHHERFREAYFSRYPGVYLTGDGARKDEDGYYWIVGRAKTVEAAELQEHVRRELSPIAKPDRIQFAPALPKTRSGKIMRRILRKIAAGKLDEIGDTSTLADPSVVETLIGKTKNH